MNLLNTRKTAIPVELAPPDPDYEVLNEYSTICAECGQQYDVRISISPRNIVITERTPCFCTPLKDIEKERLHKMSSDIRQYFKHINMINPGVALGEIKVRPGQEEAVAGLRTYRGGGLVLQGPPGRGKTYLTLAFAREQVERRAVLAVKSIDLLNAVRRSLFSDGQKTNLIYILKTVDLLILDDIGKENPTDWVLQTLYEVIDYRYDKGKDTIYTTNLDGKEMAEKFTSALASRILGNKTILVGGKDWRLLGSDR